MKRLKNIPFGVSKKNYLINKGAHEIGKPTAWESGIIYIKTILNTQYEIAGLFEQHDLQKILLQEGDWDNCTWLKVPGDVLENYIK